MDQVDGDGHDPEADQRDQQLPGRPVEDLVDEGGLLALGLAALARGDLVRAVGQRPRDPGLTEADQPLDGPLALRAAVAVAPAGLGELRIGQGDQTDGQHPEEEPPARLLGDGLEGAGLVGLGAAARATRTAR